jgi:predicted DNA repair protein MutK
MRCLSIAGTAAMFLVGGGILSHGLPALQRSVAALAARFEGFFGPLIEMVANGAVGIVAGGLSLAAVATIAHWRENRQAPRV